jgi:probable HAF family extracellular repeat protein
MESKSMDYHNNLFAALAIPVRLASQEQQQQEHSQEQHRYKLVDIGTFGGPASSVSFDNGVNGAPDQVLNHRGTVVGSADTSIPDPDPNCQPGVPVGDCFLSHAFQWQNGVLTDLGTLPGGQNNSYANWISDNELIAGASQNGVINPLFGGLEYDAVLWQNGQIIDLGTLGGNGSTAYSVNNRGQVVGVATNAIPDPFSFAGTELRGFIWENGVMQDLGTLGGPQGWALFINERGQVAGFSLTNFTANPTTDFPTQDPFLWENGRMLDLGTLGGTMGFPRGLNIQGQVIGVSNLAGDQMADPFLWDKTKLIDLRTSTIGGTPFSANAICDTGKIVGGGAFPGRVFDAYVWRNGKATDLGTLDGDCYSEAWAINAGGQVVGISVPCDFSNIRAFLWDNRPMIDLNARIPTNSSLQVVWATTINDRGEIAGIGVPPGVLPQNFNSSGRAYLLIPCHENDTEGCEDRGEGTASVAQGNPAPLNQKSMTVPQGSPTSREIMAQIHARLPQRHQIPGLGARQAK